MSESPVVTERQGVAGDPPAEFMRVPVDLIDPNPDQVRTVFDPDDLDGLTASILEVGVLQPIVVRRAGERYQLVMGERRWRAARQAGLNTIPALVRDVGDSAMRTEALLENLQREQLSPMELAGAYQALLEELSCSSEELAKRLGVSYQQVRFTLRLLDMPIGVQRRLSAGVLTFGHAKALLALEDFDLVERFADRIVAEGWSVRTLEEQVLLVRSLPAYGGVPRRKPAGRPKSQPRDYSDTVSRLEAMLETSVQVGANAAGGRVVIRFADDTDLARILGALGVPRA
jgi:ParB family chromosome partitioning protein